MRAFLFMILFLPIYLLGQKEHVINGFVKGKESGYKLMAPDVEIYENNTFRHAEWTKDSTYLLKLKKNRLYEIIITCQNYKTKKQLLSIDNDSTIHFLLEEDPNYLPEVQVIEFLDYGNKKKFEVLKRRVLKVRPYSLIVKNTLDSLRFATEGLSKRKRKRALRKAKKHLKKQFSERIKNLYTKDGMILIKLIHRETEKTVYDLLKENIGILNTIGWQITARIGTKGKLNLKTKYNKEKVKEDQWIELIIQQQEQKKSF